MLSNMALSLVNVILYWSIIGHISVSGCVNSRVEECPVLPASVWEGRGPSAPLQRGPHRHGGGGGPLRGGAVLQGKQAGL